MSKPVCNCISLPFQVYCQGLVVPEGEIDLEGAGQDGGLTEELWSKYRCLAFNT